MPSLPVRIGMLISCVLAVAVALVVLLDALSFARARADAQRATVAWSVHDLARAAEAGLARGVPLASTGEALAQRLDGCLAQEPSLRWIVVTDLHGAPVASAGHAPSELPGAWLEQELKPGRATTLSENAELAVLATPLTGVAEAEGVLAIAYDRTAAQAEAAAFAARLRWLGFASWGVASGLLTALLAWAAAPHLRQLRAMEDAINGRISASGDAELDATLARIRSATEAP